MVKKGEIEVEKNKRPSENLLYQRLKFEAVEDAKRFLSHQRVIIFYSEAPPQWQ